jgi:PilZ domain
MTDTPERRLAPRYEVLAQANIASGDEATLLPVRNISSTGAFLEGNPSDYPGLKLGAELEVTLSASDPSKVDGEVIDVRCKGRVARVEPAKATRVGGFGLTLAPATREDDARLRTLLARASHIPPPRPASLNA